MTCKLLQSSLEKLRGLAISPQRLPYVQHVGL